MVKRVPYKVQSCKLTDDTENLSLLRWGGKFVLWDNSLWDNFAIKRLRARVTNPFSCTRDAS